MTRYLRKTWERIIEAMLFLSGTITSITVVLIIFFLFKEGLGLFNKRPVEDSTVIASHISNPIKKLSPNQIRDIFNQKVVNWKEVGGKDEPIIRFTVNDIANFYTEEQIGENFEHLSEKIDEHITKTPGIIAVFSNAYQAKPFHGHIFEISTVKIRDFIGGQDWFPTSTPAAELGVLPLILGTLWVSLGAILLALPLGLATAIYLAEIADPRLRSFLKPLIELLASIPSVVYGFFGLVVIVPLIKDLFRLDVGETALAGSFILAIMALPTIITISEDAIRNTPKVMKEASLALGATQWQTIVRVIIPYSISGITAGAILGMGRAIGETMAVLMVTGNAAVMPHSFLQPVRTIPATIAAELGESTYGGLHFRALFALGCILFLITFGMNIFVELIASKRKYNKI